MPAVIVLALTLAGLTGLAGCAGDAGLGEACNRHGDCGASMQCVKRTCMPRCQRAPDCGDGYACDEQGFCRLARGQLGSACTSEIDCGPGLSCRIQFDATGHMLQRCALQAVAAPAGAACTADGDCRNGTCALGRCVDLCSISRHCALGSSCMQIPHVASGGEPFFGCLPSNGVVSWTIPSPRPDKPQVILPVPSGATYASLVLSTPAPRTAAVTQVASPGNLVLYRLCDQDGVERCSEATQRAQYYNNSLRHRPEVGMAVLAIPSTSRASLETGAYRVTARTFHVDGSFGPPPALTAVVRLGGLVGPPPILDLHFHFLDLSDHPCAAAFGVPRLDQASAQLAGPFQREFLETLKAILTDHAALALGAVTYEDIAHPDLDGLEVGSVGALLALGKYPRGINVFFVRNLSPGGIQAYAPNPGPAGLGGTPRSGIVLGMDSLCYRSWAQLARLAAHEMARYMGLYPNVEIGGKLDGLDDTDASSDNLMFYSELGAMSLSPSQRDILRRSPVLR